MGCATSTTEKMIESDLQICGTRKGGAAELYKRIQTSRGSKQKHVITIVSRAWARSQIKQIKSQIQELENKKVTVTNKLNEDIETHQHSIKSLSKKSIKHFLAQVRDEKADSKKGGKENIKLSKEKFMEMWTAVSCNSRKNVSKNVSISALEYKRKQENKNKELSAEKRKKYLPSYSVAIIR